MPLQHNLTNVQSPASYSLSTRVKCENTNGQSPRPLWAPFFLRRSIMVVFLMVFWVCLGGLVALYLYTERHGRSLGIQTDRDKYFYLWTYGPTAVFTAITACWAQVEYRACQLMPWVLMHRGPTPASQSIFLDYVSKLNIVSLYQSLKQRHFLVSLCVAGSLLLNGATVVSTGLFELDSIPITRPINLTVTARFSSANFNPYSSDRRAAISCISLYNRNLSRPVGTHKNYVYPPFLPSSLYSVGNDTIPTDRSYQAALEIIEVSLDCQNGTISCEPFQSGESNTTRYSPVYKSPDGCRYHRNPETEDRENERYPMPENKSIDTKIEFRGCKGENPDYFMEEEALRDFLRETPGHNLSEIQTADPVVMDNWDTDWRLWASIAPVNPSSVRKACTAWDTHPRHVIVCKPRYDAYLGPVKIWRGPADSTISVDIKRQRLNATEKIPGIQASKLIRAAEMPEIGALTSTSSVTFAVNDTSLHAFWTDMAEFTDFITESVTCLMQQKARNGLLRDDLHFVEGTEQTIESRLFIRQMSFWLMAILLVILITLDILLLCLFVPVAVCPRDTGSIGGIATILSRSPSFMAAFTGSQFKSEECMKVSILGKTNYRTLSDTKGAFILLPKDQAEFQSTETHQDLSAVWWQPFSSTWFLRVAVIALPIAVIIGLESVYHISTSHRGITLVDGKSQYIHYLWAYIPALLMFTIRCLFVSVEFGVRIMQPYSRLREGFAPPETSIFENQLRKVAPYAMFDTIRKKQWALTAATLALLLAVLNPVFVSGLFTVEVAGPTSPVSLTQTSRWNLGGNDSLLNGMQYYLPRQDPSDLTPGLIFHLNLSYPQWTYNDLAFPQLAIANARNFKSEAGFIETRIPALRGRFKCALDPSNGGCRLQKGGIHFPLQHPCFREDIIYERDEGETESFHVDHGFIFKFSRGFNDGFDSVLPFTLPSNCSTHALLYIKNLSHNRTCDDFRYITCNATIEEVQVDTRLQLPSLLIDLDTPPRVVEGSARTPFETNVRSFPSFTDLSNLFFNTGTNFSFNDDINTFNKLSTTISKGLNGVPLSELFENQEKMNDRLSTVWGITIAQLFNNGARKPFNSPFNVTDIVEPATATAPIYTGIYHDGRNYLVQNKISTRILEGLLGSMVVCALISMFVMRANRIIPKSPTSIASVASFLYGSHFLNSGIPSGAEWCSDEELKEQGTFEGQSFSMDWWEMEQPRSQGGSDISSVSENGTEKKGVRFGIDVDRSDSPLYRT